MDRLAKILTLAAALALPLAAHADIRLPHIFSNGMILQQKAHCPVWGWGNPGEQVTVECSWGVKAQAMTAVSGKWEVTVTTPSYGGPYTITISGSNTIQLSDVLIGDVYITAGEVNMEMPLHGMNNDTVLYGQQAIKEAAASNNHSIRVLGVPKRVSFINEEDVAAYWVDLTSNTIEFMSAMSYFFATKINQETGVPIGIINAAWGGTRAESWMTEEYLSQIPEYATDIELYHGGVPQQETLLKWVKSHEPAGIAAGYENIKYPDTECARIKYDDSQWQAMMIPCYFDLEDKLGAYDGAVWFRKWVEIPPEWQDKQLILSLGPIDDMDETFVNGEMIGRHMGAGMYSTDRIYKIHPSLVRPGNMLIAVRMIDDGDNGGICGRPEQLKIYPENEEDQSISIAGEWKYHPVAEKCEMELYYLNYRKHEYFQRPKINVTLNNKTLFAAYKAMLKPIAPFAVRGTLWCQGESNLGLGKAEAYSRLLPLLAQCWRSEFRSPDMKFYYTQQYPYPYMPGTMSYELREAQRRCMSDIPGSGMACMIDMGRKESLRTFDKKTEGERLALWALRDIYGKRVEPMGPELESFTVNKSNSSIELTFKHATGGLVAKGGVLSDFEISDNNGNFVPATAHIEGNKIIVSNPDVSKPRNVRYAFHEWIESASLYNGAGMPASSFTTEKSYMADSESIMKDMKSGN